MQRILSIALCAFSFAIAARAQERRIEISPFAGGYFDSGFQQGGFVDIFGRKGTSGEPNSGIFGVRGSHELTRSLALEGTFGFSPTGHRFREGPEFRYFDSDDFLIEPFFLVIEPLFPAIRAGETYHYAANILYELSNRGGWVPFFTAGAGAVTRTRIERALTPTIRPYLSPDPILSPPTISPYLSLYPGVDYPVVDPETQTNLSVNLGGGVKKYLTRRYGIRFDFRSYISQPSGDTVNNMELSFGLIFRL